jgi:hypothetical protein
MSDKYVKNGKLYESGAFKDRELGEIRHSPTGDYVMDGLTMYEVSKDLSGKVIVVTNRDYLKNEEKGDVITKNPFNRHGQESKEYSKKIYNNSNEKSSNRSKNSKNTFYAGSSSSYYSNDSKLTRKEKIENFIKVIAVLIFIGSFVFGVKSCLSTWGKAGYNGSFSENFTAPFGAFLAYALCGFFLVRIVFFIIKEINE